MAPGDGVRMFTRGQPGGGVRGVGCEGVGVGGVGRGGGNVRGFVQLSE